MLLVAVMVAPTSNDRIRSSAGMKNAHCNRIAKA
jgi:hypothetical protein